MYTRKQYMNNECSHHEYFGAIAKKAVSRRMFPQGFIDRCKKALAKGDEHLNKIPLREWDGLAAIHKAHIMPVVLEVDKTCSLADLVCTLKASVYNIIEEDEIAAKLLK